MKRLILFLCSILGLSCAGSTQPQDLKTRIEKKLNDALDQFESTNNAFLFTIYHRDTAIVQVVHRSYIEETRDPKDEFGLAINVTFDPTFQKEIDNHRKFKELSISKMFTNYDWDGIPCYALDLDKDPKKGAEILSTLLTDLYGFSDKSELELELLDQGQLK